MHYLFYSLTYTVQWAHKEDSVFKGFCNHVGQYLDGEFIAIAWFDGEPELWTIASTLEKQWEPDQRAIDELRQYYRRIHGRNGIRILVYRREF